MRPPLFDPPPSGRLAAYNCLRRCLCDALRRVEPQEGWVEPRIAERSRAIAKAIGKQRVEQAHGRHAGGMVERLLAGPAGVRPGPNPGRHDRRHRFTP